MDAWALVPFVPPARRALIFEIPGQGRMKFVRPLYRDLFGWEAQRKVATDTFTERESNYHPICSKMLKQDLKLA